MGRSRSSCRTKEERWAGGDKEFKIGGGDKEDRTGSGGKEDRTGGVDKEDRTGGGGKELQQMRPDGHLRAAPGPHKEDGTIQDKDGKVAGLGSRGRAQGTGSSEGRMDRRRDKASFQDMLKCADKVIFQDKEKQETGGQDKEKEGRSQEKEMGSRDKQRQGRDPRRRNKEVVGRGQEDKTDERAEMFKPPSARQETVEDKRKVEGSDIMGGSEQKKRKTDFENGNKEEVKAESGYKKDKEVEDKMKKLESDNKHIAKENSRLRGKLHECRLEKMKLESEMAALRKTNHKLAELVEKKETEKEIKDKERTVFVKKVSKRNVATMTKPFQAQEIAKSDKKKHILEESKEEKTDDEVDGQEHLSLMGEVMRLKRTLGKVLGGAPPEQEVKRENVEVEQEVEAEHEEQEQELEADMKVDQVEPNVCAQCGKAVKKSSMRHHVRAVHLKQNRFAPSLSPPPCTRA